MRAFLCSIVGDSPVIATFPVAQLDISSVVTRLPISQMTFGKLMKFNDLAKSGVPKVIWSQIKRVYPILPLKKLKVQISEISSKEKNCLKLLNNLNPVKTVRE